jgi:Arc/MetJ-type ribon-helix-helix transcriptional regulator
MAHDSITITVSDQATVDWIRSKVRDGQFASETEAIEESISRLREDDAQHDARLRDLGVARYQSYMANPDDVFSMEEVEEYLETREIKQTEPVR